MSEVSGSVRRGRSPILSFAASLGRRVESETQLDSERIRAWVVVDLESEHLAIEVDAVREIVRVGAITRVPEAPRFVRGIINHRGRIVPLIDLRLRLWFSEGTIEDASRIVIVEVAGHEFGLLVDRANQIARISTNVVEPLPAEVHAGWNREYLLGVHRTSERVILLLSVEALVRPDA